MPDDVNPEMGICFGCQRPPDLCECQEDDDGLAQDDFYELIPLHKLEEAFGVDRKTAERATAYLGYLYRRLASNPKHATD